MKSTHTHSGFFLVPALFLLECALKRKKKSFDGFVERAAVFTSLLLLLISLSHRNKNPTLLKVASALAASSLCWPLMCCQASVSSAEQPNVTGFGTSSNESRCIWGSGQEKHLVDT